MFSRHYRTMNTLGTCSLDIIGKGECGKTKSRVKRKPQENQPPWGKTKSASFYPKKIGHQSS